MAEANIKFVCLSDLHLGAKYSVLTKIDEETKNIVRSAQLSEAARSKSDTLIAFAKSIRNFIPPETDEARRPQLVLLGDVLDLSFSNWSDTMGTFCAFIDALFPEDKDWVFSSKILLVPGNHDHQLWKTIKERWYAREISDGRNPDHLKQITGLFDKPKYESELLTSMSHALPQCKGRLKVVAAYPNFAVANEKRCVIMHHGHFIEKTYTAMSDLGDWLFRRNEPKTAETLEAQNGPWINFGWSSLSSQGAAEDAQKEYLTLQDPAGMHAFIRRAARKIMSVIGGGVPISANEISAKAPGITVQGLIEASLDFAVDKAAGTERNSFLSVLGPDSVHGLKSYLSGPVHRQLMGSKKPEMFELETSFIFGHTHKPFQDRLINRWYRQPINVFNTGGWVLDLPKMCSSQGSAAVFVDDDLNVATLRLFNVPLNDNPGPVEVCGVGGYPDTENPLLMRMRKQLGSGESWKEFTDAFHRAIQLRARIAADFSFDPTLNPPVKAAAGVTK